jgi:hypothetical protein
VKAATHSPTFLATAVQNETTSAEEAVVPALQEAGTSTYRVTTAVTIRDGHANPTTADNDVGRATRVTRETVHHRTREGGLQRIATEIVREGEGETREISGAIGEMDGLGVEVRKGGIGIEIRGGTIFIGGVRDALKIKGPWRANRDGKFEGRLVHVTWVTHAMPLHMVSRR